MYIYIYHIQGREKERGQRKNMSIGTESTERARIVLTSLLAAIKNELETKKKLWNEGKGWQEGVGRGPGSLEIAGPLFTCRLLSSYRYPVTFCGGPRIAQIFEWYVLHCARRVFSMARGWSKSRVRQGEEGYRKGGGEVSPRSARTTTTTRKIYALSLSLFLCSTRG